MFLDQVTLLTILSCSLPSKLVQNECKTFGTDANIPIHEKERRFWTDDGGYQYSHSILHLLGENLSMSVGRVIDVEAAIRR